VTRLLALAEAVPWGSRVADIGTDHGALPLLLAQTGRAAFCVATEPSEARLARVARPAPGAPWAGRLAYRSGDGLDALRPEDRIDTVIIAGLGGRTIVRLLERPALRRLGPARLVLQPRTEEPRVRDWLSRSGWRLAGEIVAVERERMHVTLIAEPGDDADLYAHPGLDRDDLLAAGPHLVRSRLPAVAAWWRGEKLRLDRILSRAEPGASRDRAREAHGRAARVLAVISRRGG